MKYFVALFLSIFLISNSAYAEKTVFYHFDFGTWFGGEKLAQNPDGDDYKAGSGSVFGLGLDWKFSEKHQLFFRNNIGYRYQGAKSGSGGNRGMVYETALSKQINRYNIVGGLHFDFEAVTKDYDGNRVEYDPALGQYLAIEYMSFETWGFGLKYLNQKYTLSNNLTVSGNQFGLFLTGKF